MAIKEHIRETLFNGGVIIGPDNVARYQDPPKGLDVPGTEYFVFVSDSSVMDIDNNFSEMGAIESASVDPDTGLLTVIYVNGEVGTFPPGKFTSSQRSYLGISPREVGSYKMPKTLSELNDLFPILFPDYKQKMYYDVMRERECIDPSMFDSNEPEGNFVDLDEPLEYKYYDVIERRLRQLGCEGSFPGNQIRYMALISKFYDTKRNRFKEWILSLKWDGKNRVDTWFQTVFNASAPPLEPYGLDSLYLAKVARAWFMGAIARMDAATVHEVVPVLIGKQGNGKTSGLRYTAGNPEWFIDTTADVSSPHGKMEFLDSVRGRVVVELAESTQIRTKDQEKLKAFISMKEDQYRKPYLRRDGTYPRHFILAASSNLDDVFTDLTGNRRYYPIYCHAADLSLRTKYNVEQVWAEAYHMYVTGEMPYVSSDWMPALIMQEFATAENSNVSAIDDWLDDYSHDNGVYARTGAIITKDDIMYYVFGVTSPLPGSPQDQAWKAWKRGTKKWAPVGYSKLAQSTKRNSRAYTRISVDAGPTAQVAAAVDNNGETYRVCYAGAMFTDAVPYLDGSEENLAPRYRGKSPAEIFHMVCEENDIINEFSVFPTEGLNQRIITSLQDGSYIHYDKLSMQYRTVTVRTS